MSLLLNKYTEKELAVNNEIQLFRLSKLFKEDHSLFSELCNALPFYININNIRELDSSFSNVHFQDMMELSGEEIISGGLSLIRSISHKETLDLAIRIIRDYEDKADHEAICSYFQYMKFHGKWQWVFTYKMFLNDHLYLNMGQKMQNLGRFGKMIEDILGETTIRQDGWRKFSTLTRREKQILKMIANGYSRKDLSEQLFISENTVHTHRKNIMQKIDANSTYDIMRFSQAFELIGQL